MDDEEYDFIDRVQVEEEHGSWQIVTIHRHKVIKGVCLFYGVDGWVITRVYLICIHSLMES